MRRWLSAAAMAAAVLVALTAQPAAGAQRAADRLDVYTAVVRADQLQVLTARGFELSGAREVAGGTEVQLVLSKSQRAALTREGIKTRLTRVKGGRTVRQFAAAHGVTDASLRYWGTRLADEEKEPEATVRRPTGATSLARVVRPGEAPPAGGRIMVVVGKASVVVEAGFDAAHLRDVVRALGEVG